MKNLTIGIILLIGLIITGCGYSDRQARERVNKEEIFSKKLISKEIAKVEGLTDSQTNSYAKIIFTDGTFLNLYHDNHDNIIAKLGMENEKPE